MVFTSKHAPLAISSPRKEPAHTGRLLHPTNVGQSHVPPSPPGVCAVEPRSPNNARPYYSLPSPSHTSDVLRSRQDRRAINTPPFMQQLVPDHDDAPHRPLSLARSNSSSSTALPPLNTLAQHTILSRRPSPADSAYSPSVRPYSTETSESMPSSVATSYAEPHYPPQAVSPPSAHGYAAPPPHAPEGYATPRPPLPPSASVPMGHPADKHGAYYPPPPPAGHGPPYASGDAPPYAHHTRPQEHHHQHVHDEHVLHARMHHPHEPVHHPHQHEMHPREHRHHHHSLHHNYEHPPYHPHRHHPHHPPAPAQPYAHGFRSEAEHVVNHGELRHPPPRPFEHGSGVHLHDGPDPRRPLPHQMSPHTPLHASSAPTGTDIGATFRAAEDPHGAAPPGEFSSGYNTFRINGHTGRPRAASYAITSTQSSLSSERADGPAIDAISSKTTFAPIVPTKRGPGVLAKEHDMVIDSSVPMRDTAYTHAGPDKAMTASVLSAQHQQPQSSSAARRAAQNRAAQRAFRQRKERYVKELEYKARVLTQAQKRLRERREQANQLRQLALRLQRENAALQARLTKCKCPGRPTRRRSVAADSKDEPSDSEAFLPTLESVDALLADEPSDMDEDIIHPPAPVLPFPELDAANAGKDAGPDRKKTAHALNTVDLAHC
ncbi:hypothetical protein THASP1DRAFT_29673 [Thamnocephalis sphaerospora]|uniref:BZIP domain-containing protein n=1 Tax=Thamnocephalis sphaerospora TaxID=78915 RepID=A0A4P9XR40_9FUNG|nr:hypothetical protein THASP1DRAFT_29673 [Thamnocephalis sphaerospora]|eukprot:RKP08518.1 hypothetical protein THASP1DRAFT_29673 [Thamnocephalis sphaerospora]